MAYEEQQAAFVQKIKDLDSIKREVRKLEDVASKGFTKRIIEQIDLELRNLTAKVLNIRPPGSYTLLFTREELDEVTDCVFHCLKQGRENSNTLQIANMLHSILYRQRGSE